MASNYRPRSSSSDSRRSASPTRRSSARQSSYRQPRARTRTRSRDVYATQSVGDIQLQQRRAAARDNRRRWSARLVIILVVIALVAGGCLALYLAPIAKVKNISIKGVEHLTQEEMLALAQVPQDTTLLRVDAAQIQANCLRDAWIEKVQVRRVFPDTLELVVTERSIAATVAVPEGTSGVTRIWAIASDGIWLMPIPDKESEAAATVSEQIYTDVESVLQIVDVPYGTSPEIGAQCTDSNVLNALSIVAGMTTDLADEVVRVSATDAESTILTLSNGVEIAFGSAEDIRDKERVCLALLEEYEGSIAYINVRTVSNPTWRST